MSGGATGDEEDCDGRWKQREDEEECPMDNDDPHSVSCNGAASVKKEANDKTPRHDQVGS